MDIRYVSELNITLPDGTVLKAMHNDMPLYPGISIYAVRQDGKEERLCFVEMNPEKPAGARICVGVHRADEGECDDASIYVPYAGSEDSFRNI